MAIHLRLYDAWCPDFYLEATERLESEWEVIEDVNALGQEHAQAAREGRASREEA